MTAATIAHRACGLVGANRFGRASEREHGHVGANRAGGFPKLGDIDSQDGDQGVQKGLGRGLAKLQKGKGDQSVFEAVSKDIIWYTIKLP